MIPAQIEKEVVVEAPIDAVWRVITEPRHIKQWFASEAELEPRVGAEGRLHFESGSTSFLQIEAYEPPHRFAYRWLHQEGTRARPENSTLVEFILQPEGDKTRIRVVESGFDQIDWGDEAKAKLIEDHSRGWQVLSERLRDYAPRADARAAE
jgi:uncharacterized protein YndB with AHSA1/START domain